MKKKLLFVAAMTLAAFGASAEAVQDFPWWKTISPEIGEREQSTGAITGGVVDQLSAITLTFDQEVFLRNGKDTLNVTPDTWNDGYITDDNYTTMYGYRLTKTDANTLVITILDENNQEIVLTNYIPYTVVLGAGLFGDAAFAADNNTGHCFEGTMGILYQILPNVASISPAGGTVVNELSTLTATFADKVYLNEDEFEVKDNSVVVENVVATMGMLRQSYSARFTLAADSLGLTIDVLDAQGEKTSLTEASHYNVTIPEKLLVGTFTPWSGDLYVNEAEIFSYEVPFFHVESVTPADGSELISLTGVTITFKEEIAEILNDSAAFINRDRTADAIRGNIVLNEDNKSITIYPKSREINEPGTYTLVIPAEAITDVDGHFNSELTFNYVITNGVTGDITISPKAGMVLSLKDFVLDFGENVAIEWNCQENITITDAEGKTVATVTGDDIHEEDMPDNYWENPYPLTKITINLPEAITKAGTYRLNIPEGRFNLGETGDSGNNAMAFNYTVADTIRPVNVDPEPGTAEHPAELPAITDITLTFDADMIVCDTVVTIQSLTSTDPATSLYNAFLRAEGKNIIVSPMSREIPDAGTYVVIIPEGAVATADKSKTNPELDYRYVVVAGETVNVTIDPADGSTVKELKVFTIDLGAAGGLSYNTQEKITITDAAGNVVAEATDANVEPVDPEAWEESEWVITFPTAVTTAGEYVLTIPMDFFNVGDVMNPVLHYHYTVDAGVSAITEVEAVAEGVTVYNLQGVPVLKSDNAADVKTLESGLYIVNGKKVIIVK